MAASAAGALKAKVESAGLGVAAFRDEARERPDGTPQPLPYVTITEGISTIPESHFNPLDDAMGHVSELNTVHLWEEWRNQSTRALVESMTLRNALVRALHGVRLPMAPTLVFQCSVDSAVRLLDRKANRVHTAITVRLRRVM